MSQLVDLTRTPEEVMHDLVKKLSGGWHLWEEELAWLRKMGHRQSKEMPASTADIRAILDVMQKMYINEVTGAREVVWQESKYYAKVKNICGTKYGVLP